VTKEKHIYFEIINAAAMKADTINPDGTFVFKDVNIANILKKDAQRNGIKIDETTAKTEFKLENTNIVIYSSFNEAISAFPMAVETNKLKENYCYYSKEDCRLIILDFDKDHTPCSFYFSLEGEIKNNKEYSLSNIFYWQKIYELLYKNISEEPCSDKSIYINSFEKGKCKFYYSPYNSTFNEKDLQQTYNHFAQIYDLTNRYPVLLKNRCVERLSKQNESTLENLIYELDEICNKVEIDFAIFIENFDFDSYLQKYNEKVQDFISQARNIIEKMLSNIFTLPLTYAGAIFAFDKLSDNSFSSFIFIAMCIYTLFSCGFLIYEIMDTTLINRSFEKELRNYTNNSPTLLKKVESDKKSIKCRLIWIKIICSILVCIFISLLIYFRIRICL